MRITSKRTLADITSSPEDYQRASDLGYSTFQHTYDPALLESILAGAREIFALRGEAPEPEGDAQPFLGLRHVRNAHNAIPQVAELMNDPERLSALGELAETRLEPYPISTAAAHVNYYPAGSMPIHFHTDGPAFVELIPLSAVGSTEGGSTVIYEGPAEQAEHLLQDGKSLPSERLHLVPQRCGQGTLMQGRMLMHAAEALSDGERITLVLPLRSAEEPWKDGNTLMRLLLDDDLEAVRDEWIADQQRMVAKYREKLASRSPG